MTQRSTSAALHGALVTLGALFLGAYFVMHAVQGEYGVFNRMQIEAEEERLIKELAALETQLADIENKSRRLSDGYLDLDLLDQQARDILGYARSDEILIQ
ncbi:MAG: septum formation initiator family protein [Dinoroseobacter sp.]|nr:septum formation initiator family protein [Dinoroseobacter sp.]MDJ0992597.1 septum formation initiator family protein [Dinoroseobacter sp.]